MNPETLVKEKTAEEFKIDTKSEIERFKNHIDNNERIIFSAKLPYPTIEDSLYFSKDTVYHYTNIYTAMEHIFLTNKLRLSPLDKVNDPKEKDFPDYSIFVCGYSDIVKDLETKYDGNKLNEDIINFYSNIKQLCLCRNKNIKISSFRPFFPIERFGFSKPRMWDQYGGNYEGICIALSLSKLRKKLKKDYKFLNVNYYTNEMLSFNKTGIDLNQADKLGEQYKNELIDNQLKILAMKHIDYKDEKELKLIINNEKEFDYIDISHCIKGIFITNKISSNYKQIVINKAMEWNVDVFILSFRKTGISINILNRS